MLNIRMEGDRELRFDLERMAKLAPRTIEQVVRRSAILIDEKVKRNLNNQILQRRTSRLIRSIAIKYGGSRDRAHAEIGTNVIYAPVHEFGATITAKNAPYLWFKIQTASRIVGKGGKALKRPRGIFQYVRTKRVTIPARPFMKPAFEEALPLIDRIIDEELRKLTQ